jgi:hypothetical protein
MRAPTADPQSYRSIAANPPPQTLAGIVTPTFYPQTWPAPQVSSGRFGHIYHPESNTHWFGVITSFTTDPTTGAIKVQMAQAPGTIPQKPGSTCGLGIGDTGGGWIFSVVSRVQYSIQNLAGGAYANSQYAPIVAPPADPNQARVSGDSGRTELVRIELDKDNNPIVGSMQVAAEYAVDLRFGITVATPGGSNTPGPITNNNYNPSTTTYAITQTGDPNVYTYAADVQHGGHPQWIRAVQVRLSTRARVPDRDTALPTGLDGRLLRFLVDPTLQPAYARVRTEYANVALPNQQGFSLW